MTTADDTSNDGSRGTSGPDDAQTVAADVTSPGEPLTQGEDAPTSGPLKGADGGTAAGAPLAGTGTPSDEPAYPDGSDEPSGAPATSSDDADPAEPGGRG
jgi:hypothetical protein